MDGNSFRFSFIEEFKQKSYRVTLAILFIISLISIPAVTFMSNGMSGGTSFRKVILLFMMKPDFP